MQRTWWPEAGTISLSLDLIETPSESHPLKLRRWELYEVMQTLRGRHLGRKSRWRQAVVPRRRGSNNTGQINLFQDRTEEHRLDSEDNLIMLLSVKFYD